MNGEQPREEDRYPLSAVQYAMLLHSIVAPADGVYIQQKTLTLRETLDVPSFEGALLDLAARHPVLRTSFALDAPDGVRQVVRSEARVELTQADWRGSADRLHAYLAADRRMPLDFAQGPPMRFALIRTGDRCYEFIWTSHHALMDGRSYLILLTELFELYGARIAGREITLPARRPFADYIHWLGEGDLSKAEAFWRRRLAGITTPTPLGCGEARALHDGEPMFAETTAALSESLTSALVDAAPRHGVTANSFIQGIWALLLTRLSGCTEILFGTAKSCRALIEGGREMVGLCINTIPFRAHVDPAQTAIEFLRQLREEQIAVRGFEHTPLPLIREWCAVPRQEPLFESVVVFEDFLVNTRLRALGEEWANREFRLNERSNYPLTLSAYLDTSLTLKLGYDRRRFTDRAAEAMLSWLRSLLEHIVLRTEMRLDELLHLPASIGRAEWNNTAADYPRDRCAHQLFAEQARRRPEAVAVVFEGSAMTYGELDRRSSQLAAFLCRNGIGPGSLAGIYMDRSMEMVVALLGVMKSGGAYVPVDPAYPPERIAYMLNDARLPLLLTHSSAMPSVRGGNTLVVGLDEIWDELMGGHAQDDAFDRAAAEEAAYVIYTSGSTGHPKGVKVGHRALTNLLWSVARIPEFTASDRLLAVTTICFDIAGLELYLPLISGGTVELASAAAAADGFALRSQIERSRPTVMQATPATWKMLLAAGWRGDRNLKILSGGEALPCDLADELASRAGELWNLYGPTETTIWSSLSRVEAGSKVTIGRPIANTQFHILDERLQPVLDGVPGELFIAGDGVAEGYLDRPELTAERFLPCPFGTEGARMYRTGDVVRVLDDGNLEYLHRVDRQVKLHGYRIEPGEIEYALRRHPSVREAVAMVREDAPGDRRIVGYVVAQPGNHPREAELRRHLKTTLPDHQIPAAFVAMDRIPLMPNGKVDYNALPLPSAARGEEVAAQVPANEWEKRIAAIWSKVLGRERVALDDSFFEAGGNSLLLMEVVKWLQQAIRQPLTSTDMFAHPTVRSMAAHLTGKSEDGRADGRDPAARRGTIAELRQKRLAFNRRNAVT